MKFLYSDSLDFVDPAYDFELDRGAEKRRAHQDDDYPHEHLHQAPYDGLLISRAIVGDGRRLGKYTDAQSIRFRREGARAFLRFPQSKYPSSIVMGDCGAFSYRDAREPPYSVSDTLEFYADAGFTHGCSVDHLIFDFLDDREKPSPDVRHRYDITLANAEAFFSGARALGRGFTPLGVIQGWSPASMARAATSLAAMGYSYLAVGGMVPLRIEQIERALSAIHSALPPRVRLHLLGFGKTDHLDRIRPYRVASFDTTSPLVRAFKDAKRNYYARAPRGGMEYYTAVRIPQALENDRLSRSAKRGHLDQESLLRLERAALDGVRAYAKRRASLERALDGVLKYGRYALWDGTVTPEKNEAHLSALRRAYSRSLGERPWEACPCRVCRDSGVEVLIFRSSNRNKRRGIHNLYVFYKHVRENINRASA